MLLIIDKQSHYQRCFNTDSHQHNKASNAKRTPIEKTKKEQLKLKSEDQNNLHLKQMKRIESVK